MHISFDSEDKQTFLIAVASISISLIVFLPPLVIDLLSKLLQR